MRKIEYIAVHCTASSPKMTLKGLEKVFKDKGWRNPGYHYVVFPDGKICQMLADEKVSNGVKGYNYCSINVAWVGGYTGKDERTPEQKASMMSLIKLLKSRYPKAMIQGHRDFSPDLNGNGRVDKCEWIKLCPCFEAREEYKELNSK